MFLGFALANLFLSEELQPSTSVWVRKERTFSPFQYQLPRTDSWWWTSWVRLSEGFLKVPETRSGGISKGPRWLSLLHARRLVAVPPQAVFTRASFKSYHPCPLHLGFPSSSCPSCFSRAFHFNPLSDNPPLFLLPKMCFPRCPNPVLK